MEQISLNTILTLIGEIGVILGMIIPVFISMGKLKEGVKCQLRSEMLRIYYRHKDVGVVRQYEYENFVLLYDAYKTLKGNSFIEKIYSEVKTWKIES
ncbi:MAG: hypothetical protein IKV54_03365 [Clostridia bacterium]|nr:hypothetical protein [Clostridia bacterium]